MSEHTAENEQEKVPTQPEAVKWQITTGEGIRRLPVYLLLDTSGSMAGMPIQDVRLGVETFQKTGSYAFNLQSFLVESPIMVLISAYHF